MTARRPWHVQPPWPTVTASIKPTRAELAALTAAAAARHAARIASGPRQHRRWADPTLVTQARERRERRMHGDA